MKRYYNIIFILLGAFLLVSCNILPEEKHANAEVISINENLIEGHLIGHFLGSPDGSFVKDVIKVGVSFTIDSVLFLEDLSLQHAELSYYKNKTHIPLTFKNRSGYFDNEYCNVEVYLHSRLVKRLYVKSSIYHKIW